MKLEKQILKDILWNLTTPLLKNQEAFEEALIAYNKTISGKNPDLKDPILNYPEVHIQYEHWGIDEDGDEDIIEPVFLVKADNRKTFSTVELLYKIHNEVHEKLQDSDHIFFEGLNLWEENESNTPYYLLQQGS